MQSNNLVYTKRNSNLSNNLCSTWLQIYILYSNQYTSFRRDTENTFSFITHQYDDIYVVDII